MIEWKFDSCSCILIYSYVKVTDTFVYESAVQMCEGHKSLSGQNLLDTAISHGQFFNGHFGNFDETDPEYLDKQDKIRKAKAIEKSQIESNGTVRTTEAEVQTLIDSL